MSQHETDEFHIWASDELEQPIPMLRPIVIACGVSLVLAAVVVGFLT